MTHGTMILGIILHTAGIVAGTILGTIVLTTPHGGIHHLGAGDGVVAIGGTTTGMEVAIGDTIITTAITDHRIVILDCQEVTLPIIEVPVIAEYQAEITQAQDQTPEEMLLVLVLQHVEGQVLAVLL